MVNIYICYSAQVKKEFAMLDCWEQAKKPRPFRTCRFDTRIDYVFATPNLLEKWRLDSVQTITDDASDHNMVIATFNPNIPTQQ